MHAYMSACIYIYIYIYMVCMYGMLIDSCMHGWIVGWVGGWVDGWMDRWMDGWMDAWVQGWMDGWMDAWVQGWMDGWMAGWLDGWMDAWMHGCMDAWMHGCMEGGTDGRTDGGTRDGGMDRSKHACMYRYCEVLSMHSREYLSGNEERLTVSASQALFRMRPKIAPRTHLGRRDFCSHFCFEPYAVSFGARGTYIVMGSRLPG